MTRGAVFLSPHDIDEASDEALFGLAQSADCEHRQLARETLVRRHHRLARHLANKVVMPGFCRDDLHQVALIGLLAAIDGFDPERGIPFGTYAGALINGRLRHFHRDQGYVVRVPRAVTSLRGEATIAWNTLSQRSGSEPTDDALADTLGVSTEAVSTALNIGTSCTPLDLLTETDLPRDQLSRLTPTEIIEWRACLGPLLRALSARDRYIVVEVVIRERAQAQVAQTLGISQMQVSRLLRRTLAKLRTQVLNDHPPFT